MTEPTADHRRTGAAAVVAGTLLLVSVAAELLWNVQHPDGSVTSTAGFAGYLGVFLVGTVALVVAVHGTGGLVASRTGRVGRALTLSGAASLALFTASYLGSGLVSGRPAEALFWLFLLGFLLLVAGAVPLALGLRRSGAVGPWWTAVLVAGAGALVAMTTQSPVHEVGLFTFDVAWAALGLHLLRTAAPVREDATRAG
jgi:hypothetical protein